MALCEAVRYIERAGVQGSIVECGVWRGGSMMAAALTLIDLNAADRDLFLYDTFTEFPEPEDRDQLAWSAVEPEEMYRRITTDEMFDHLPVEQVVAVLEGTGYPAARVHAIQGLVEATIPDQAPDQISLCRLDTDWYRSTLHELEYLFPRIAPGGVLIIDDYGEFLGAREAVDEYFADGRETQLLHRIDASCRLIQKR